MEKLSQGCPEKEYNIEKLCCDCWPPLMGSAGASCRGKGRGSARVRLRGMGRSSVGAKLRGMGNRVGRTTMVDKDYYAGSGNNIIHSCDDICKISGP